MPRGGKREGAGRPAGRGPYGESTRPVRLPVSLVDRVMRFVKNRESAIPLYACGVSAGFPSPADDYLEGCLLYTSPSPRDKRQSRMPSSA